MKPKYSIVAKLRLAGLTADQIAKRMRTTKGKVHNLTHIAKKKGLLNKPAGVDGRSVLPASVASTANSAIDIRSAIVYLRQARNKRPAYAKVLAELALLTLLGEDK